MKKLLNVVPEFGHTASAYDPASESRGSRELLNPSISEDYIEKGEV